MFEESFVGMESATEGFLDALLFCVVFYEEPELACAESEQGEAGKGDEGAAVKTNLRWRFGS